MARVTRINKEQFVMNAEMQAISRTAQEFSHLVLKKLMQVIINKAIDQWDNPANESLLQGKLETLAAKADKTEADYVKIAAICAVLANFIDE